VVPIGYETEWPQSQSECGGKNKNFGPPPHLLNSVKNLAGLEYSRGTRCASWNICLNPARTVLQNGTFSFCSCVSVVIYVSEKSQIACRER
jgi:hypothetical protein